MLTHSLSAVKSTFSILSYSLKFSKLKTFFVILFLVFAAFAETVGILTIFPFLNILVFSEINTENKLLFYTNEIIDFLGLQPDVNLFLILIIFFLIIKTVLTILAMNYVGFISNEICTFLRMRLIENYFSANWGFFSKKPIGSLINSVSSESERSASAFVACWNFFSSLIHAIVFFLTAIFISTEVSLISIVVGALIFILLNGVMKLAKKSGDNQTFLMKSLLSYLTDYIQGIKPLKAMNQEKNVMKIVSKDNFSLRKTLDNVVISSNLIKHLPQLIILFFLGVTVFYILNFSNVELSLLAVLALLFNRILTRISLLQKYLQTLITSESAFWSIKKLNEEFDENREKNLGKDLPTLKNGITLKNIKFAYDKKNIFINLNLFIPCKKITTLFGKSGIGKTTIVDMVLGLYNAQNGKIFIDDKDLKKINLFKWREKVSYVPQETILFNDTVFNNITLKNKRFNKKQVINSLKKVSALNFIDELELGIDTMIGEKGVRMSGGQKQRISIARALIRNPELIIFDESTSSLDHKSTNEICRLMKKLSKKITIIVISHQKNILEYSDIVYKISNSKAILVK